MGSDSLDAMGNSHGEVMGTGTEVIAVIIVMGTGTWVWVPVFMAIFFAIFLMVS